MERGFEMGFEPGEDVRPARLGGGGKRLRAHRRQGGGIAAEGERFGDEAGLVARCDKAAAAAVPDVLGGGRDVEETQDPRGQGSRRRA